MKLKSVLLVASVMGFNLLATAQNSKVNADKVSLNESEAPKVFQALQKAQSLANEGQQKKSAELLVQAAKIVLDNSYQRVETAKESKPNEKDAKPAQQGQTDAHQGIAELDVLKLLAEAKTYAPNPETAKKIEDLTKQANQPRFGGAVNGPNRHYDQVSSYSSDWYAYVFQGGERAVIEVAGDGDTDLDLYIYDQNGNLVASDTDNSDHCYVSWYPRWTGRFRVKIVNRGSVYNTYVVGTN